MSELTITLSKKEWEKILHTLTWAHVDDEHSAVIDKVVGIYTDATGDHSFEEDDEYGGE